MLCGICSAQSSVHVFQRKESYVHVRAGRVVSNGGDNSLLAATPPPAPHSVRIGPDYVNDPNSLQAFNWYVHLGLMPVLCFSLP